MAKTAQSGSKTPSIMSGPWQKWPNCFLAKPILRNKHCQVYFITVQSEFSGQTDKQTKKHQDLSEKIHQ
jgi:hypothetical protein